MKEIAVHKEIYASKEHKESEFLYAVALLLADHGNQAECKAENARQE